MVFICLLTYSISCSSLLRWLHPIRTAKMKLLQKQKTSWCNSCQMKNWVPYLFCVKKCIFFRGNSFLDFLSIFNHEWLKKFCLEIYFHDITRYIKKAIFKGTLLLHKNITCLEGILFNGITFLSLSLDLKIKPSKFITKNTSYVNFTHKSKWSGF